MLPQPRSARARPRRHPAAPAVLRAGSPLPPALRARSKGLNLRTTASSSRVPRAQSKVSTTSCYLQYWASVVGGKQSGQDELAVGLRQRLPLARSALPAQSMNTHQHCLERPESSPTILCRRSSCCSIARCYSDKAPKLQTVVWTGEDRRAGVWPAAVLEHGRAATGQCCSSQVRSPLRRVIRPSCRRLLVPTLVLLAVLPSRPWLSIPGHVTPRRGRKLRGQRCSDWAITCRGGVFCPLTALEFCAFPPLRLFSYKHAAGASS